MLVASTTENTAVASVCFCSSVWGQIYLFSRWICYLVTACVARMYRFCLVCVSVCPSVCLSVRAQKVHLTGSKLLKITWKLELGMLGMLVTIPCPHGPCPSDRLDRHFLGRARVSVRAFCPFNGLHSTPNHFQTLPGHADKKAYPYPSACW